MGRTGDVACKYKTQVRILVNHIECEHVKFTLMCDKSEHVTKGNKKLPNSEQSYKGKVKTHKYINRQNQSTTGKL